MLISVQQQDFEVNKIIDQLTQGRSDIGAIVTFTGLVRDLSKEKDLVAMDLEHYPGMTEKSLESLAESALEKWQIKDLAIIHRVGRLHPTENIVMVVTISAHRKQAFDACEYLMDYLKTQAPFWKKEITRDGEHWVAAKQSDLKATSRWEK